MKAIETRVGSEVLRDFFDDAIVSQAYPSRVGEGIADGQAVGATW